MAEGQPASRLHESGIPLGDGDGGAGRNEGSATAGRQSDINGCDQVGTGIAGRGVGRESGRGMETNQGDLEHGATVLDRLTYGDLMLVWMDLEMTGLDPDRHIIVEIATLITDDELEVVAEGPGLVIHQGAEALETMDDFVRDMHTKSGLLEQIEQSTTSLDEARDQTLAFLHEHIAEAGTVPLCGNSIGTDRRFLAKQLPEIEEFLHYRSVDVSTIKELARRWYPGVLSKAPKKAAGHRALDDIRESLAELAYYRRAVFAEADKSSGTG